jgi:hypothetical protein
MLSEQQSKPSLLTELTEEESANISGGAAAAVAVGGLVEIIDHKWGSGAKGGKHRRGGKHRAPSKVSWGKIAAKLAVRGVGGAAGFALGGPIGAGLAGAD